MNSGSGLHNPQILTSIGYTDNDYEVGHLQSPEQRVVSPPGADLELRLTVKQDNATATTTGQKAQEEEKGGTLTCFWVGEKCGNSVCVFVAVLCALSFVEGISVNGLPNINISNLERRYELSSRQAGLIASSGEIGAISVVLLVSFYGGRSHRPRVVAGGGLVLALGCCFILLPHLFVGNYTVDTNLDDNDGCDVGRQSSNCNSTQHVDEDSGPSRLLPLFIFGQTLQGMGFTPAFTCGFEYIDDYASSEHTAVYIGVTYAITALGVGVGYVVGGYLLSLWVDIGRVDLSTVHITSADKRWVGAWWIGYAACAVLYVTVSSVLCMFPRHLKAEVQNIEDLPTECLRIRKSSRQQKAQLAGTPEEPKTIWQLIMSFPKAIFDLVFNPLYILLVLVGLGDTLIVSGISGFAPKIIEEKFNVKPSQSGLIMGSVTLMGGAGGLALGGLLIQRFRLKLPGMIRMCLAFLLLGAVLGGFCFFISCPEPRFAGITSAYGKARYHTPESGNLSAACNSNCTCSTLRFDPVCGEDGNTYFSSCHAGCPTANIQSKLSSDIYIKVYNSCRCVEATLKDGGQNASGRAVSGQCAEACPQVWPFVFVLFLGILFTFLNVTPISMAILRCVTPEQRSVGLGLQWVTLRLLGTIPGPILTGAVLDTSCQLWQSTCSGFSGNCWLYNSSQMSMRLFLLWVPVKMMGVAMLLIAYWLHARKGNSLLTHDPQSQSMSVPSHSLCDYVRKSPSSNVICMVTKYPGSDMDHSFNSMTLNDIVGSDKTETSTGISGMAVLDVAETGVTSRDSPIVHPPTLGTAQEGCMQEDGGAKHRSSHSAANGPRPVRIHPADVLKDFQI